MPNYPKKEITDYHILKTVENDPSVSQRRLSSQMELNVASVNFALQRLIKKGLIRMVGVNPRRIKYYITPNGLSEKTQLAYRFFGRNIHFYKEVRNDIEARIIKATNGSKTRIAIYGIDELSEITYMVVEAMRWKFAGFFIAEGSKITNKDLFGHKIQKLEALKNTGQCLLLLTDELSEEMLSDSDLKNIDILNLLSYYKY
ncbi:MAG TPA: winged helix-turn-helix transcriptional regulator [Candidatus Scalindua sp.]|nr:winged helix-turn-helix transcriptional regulator [Candidatus Scalindua sp.]